MPPPRPAPRPLAWYQETWRIVLAALGGLTLWLAQFEAPAPASLLPLLDLVIGVAALVLVHWRRRWPVLVAVLTTAATAVSALSAFASLLAYVSLVTTRRWRAIVPVTALAVLTGWVFELVRPTGSSLPFWVTALISVLVSGLALAVGLYVGARRELVDSYRERAETAEREQASRVEQARLSERARIAREMHDVLAHRISLVALHAGAMTYRTDLGADDLRGSAAVVQENAHQALVELRDVLGVLRDTSAAAPVAGSAAAAPPQPTLADLPALLEEARAAGNQVSLRGTTPALEEVPDAVGRTAYRIIQEGLTNARKHAPGAPVLLQLTGSPASGLELELRNPVPQPAAVGKEGGEPGAVPPPGAGLGLIGLTERAGLAGGTLVHGPTPTREYRVRAWLPWAP